jgi:hypothetical protein
MDDQLSLKQYCDKYGDDILQLYPIEAPNNITSYQVGATYYIRYFVNTIIETENLRNPYYKAEITELVLTDQEDPFIRVMISYVMFDTNIIIKTKDKLYVSCIIDAFRLDDAYNYVLK